MTIIGIIVIMRINKKPIKTEQVKTFSLKNSPMIKLTCPKCGETGHMRQRQYKDYILTWYYITCLNCGHRTQEYNTVRECYKQVGEDVKYVWKMVGKDITHCPYCGEKLKDNNCKHCGFES